MKHIKKFNESFMDWYKKKSINPDSDKTENLNPEKSSAVDKLIKKIKNHPEVKTSRPDYNPPNGWAYVLKWDNYELEFRELFAVEGYKPGKNLTLWQDDNNIFGSEISGLQFGELMEIWREKANKQKEGVKKSKDDFLKYLDEE